MTPDVILGIALACSFAVYSFGAATPFFSEWLIAGVGIIATVPVVLSAWKAIRRRSVTVDLLAAIALIFSILTKEWASVVFINLMITCARIFGSYTESRAKSAIQSLLTLRPERVRIKKGSNFITIPVGEVKRGDLVLIETGDRIPVDGTVVQGEASIDQSSLTGESMPIDKHEKDSVFSSTLNISGSIVVRAEKIGKDTTLEKIIHLVEHAQSGKARIQTIGDRFASWYIILTVAAASLLYLWTKNSSLVLSILLVTCADDIAVAVPMAFWSAIGYAAKRGIIVKGGNFLEGISRITTFVVDKTGTVTKGHILVHDVSPFGGATKQEVIDAAMSAAVISEHPIARAIFSYGSSAVRKKSVTAPQQFKEFPGRGIRAIADRRSIVVGNLRFMEESGIPISYDQGKRATLFENHGLTVIAVGVQGACIGFISLADQMRDHIPQTIERLRRYGVQRVIMLSGDNERVTGRIAREAGIDEYHAGLLPKDKVGFIEAMTGAKKMVAMVGDGVNDAAALSRADIGIAMGVIGSDAAIESSDIALMKDDIGKIADVIMIGRYTMRIVREDFVIWAVVNAAGLALVLSGKIGPEGAAAYNFVTDFIPLINSFRLFRYHLFPNLRMRG